MRKFVVFFIAFALFLCSACQVQPGHEDIEVPEDFRVFFAMCGGRPIPIGDEMDEIATHVFEGDVTDISFRCLDGKLYTLYHVKVTSAYKGWCGRYMTVCVPGGKENFSLKPQYQAIVDAGLDYTVVNTNDETFIYGSINIGDHILFVTEEDDNFNGYYRPISFDDGVFHDDYRNNHQFEDGYKEVKAFFQNRYPFALHYEILNIVVPSVLLVAIGVIVTIVWMKNRKKRAKKSSVEELEE